MTFALTMGPKTRRYYPKLHLERDGCTGAEREGAKR